MRTVIISIGDELVLGQTVDTNSAFLSSELARLGIGTLYHQTVADDLDAIAEAINYAAATAQLVIISGGLGPTEDDLTRQALAKAMGVELVLDQASLKTIGDMFARRSLPMPERNNIQAMHPQGTQIIPNTCGTAPGIKARIGQAVIYVAPGVPGELFTMFEKSIRPQIEQIEATRHVILTETVHTFGMGESTVAQHLAELADRQRNPLVGTTVSDGVVSVRVRSEFETMQVADTELVRTVEQVEQRLGPVAYGRGPTTIQQSLVELLKEHGLTVATAESCTAGLVGKLITDVPGASSVYVGGWVTYSNQMKIDLGVDASLIGRHGAVSEPVVEAMARLAAVRCGADLGVAVTGIAGPDGGTADKPVGTVWIGLAQRGGRAEGREGRAEGQGPRAEGREGRGEGQGGSVECRVSSDGDAGSCVPTGNDFQTRTLLVDLWGDRETIRNRAAKCAIQLLRLHVMAAPMDLLTFTRRPATGPNRT